MNVIPLKHYEFKKVEKLTKNNINKIIHGNCLDELKKLPDNSIDCCVTSPPYYALRDYGTAKWSGGDENCDHKNSRSRGADFNEDSKQKTVKGSRPNLKFICECGAIREDSQIGLEPILQEYIDNMVEICEEVRRVLKPTGTFWLNIGDTYSNYKDNKTTKQTISKREGVHEIEKGQSHSRNPKSLKEQGFKNKELMGVPWRLAFALSDAGWYLRQDIIWAKATSGQERNGNCMPESINDRMTKSHEYIFLLTKKDKYYFDNYAVKEPLNILTASKSKFGGHKYSSERNDKDRRYDVDQLDGLGNMRSVWRINLQPGSSGQHIAGYPEKLPYYCIKAGSSEKGCCADCGKPYVRILEAVGKINHSWAPGTRDFHKLEQSKGRHGSTSAFLTDETVNYKSVGWQKSCNCETNEIVPSIILDPFMGSGTTAKVALEMGRNFIGFELNEEYIEFANNRIEKLVNLSNNDFF